MTKLLENIYRSRQHRARQRAQAALPAMGIDIWEVIDAAATKPFGFQPFYPGPGVGGHCIPVDPFYLTWKAQQFGFSHALHRARRRGQRGHARLRRRSRPSAALERAGTAARRRQHPRARRRLQARRRRPARVARPHHHRPPAPRRSRRRATTTPSSPTVGSGRHYDLRMSVHAARQPGPVRLRPPRSPTTAATTIPAIVAASQPLHRHPQRHPRPPLPQHHPLLTNTVILPQAGESASRPCLCLSFRSEAEEPASRLCLSPLLLAFAFRCHSSAKRENPLLAPAFSCHSEAKRRNLLLAFVFGLCF